MTDEDFALMVGEQKAKIEEHGKQLEKLFIKVDDVKSSVDTNIVQIENTEKSLSEVKTLIKDVDRKIENGLRAKIEEVCLKVEGLIVCIDSLVECKDGVHCGEDEQTKKEDGVVGFFAEGWTQAKKKLSYFFVILSIVCCVTAVVGFSLYIIVNLCVLHRIPVEILKCIGLG